MTIPKPLRDQLGIRSGQIVEFSLRGLEVVLRKQPAPQPARSLRGKLPPGINADAEIEKLRGPAWLPDLDGSE